MPKSTPMLLSKLARGPKTELDYRDDYLALLRCVLIFGGFTWLVLAEQQLPQFASLRRIVIIFSLYSVAVYGALWLFRLPIRWVYFAIMLLDLAFAYQLCAITGGLKSMFILAFYILAGLQSYYFGLRRGLLLALPVIAVYILIDPSNLAAEFWTRHGVQLAFLVLLAVTFGILSDREKEDGRIRSELIAKLADFRRMLEQTDRVASLGRLAAGIAHNINNPVAVILSRIDCMREDLRAAETTSGIAKDIEVLRRHALKISETTNRLLGFARNTESYPSEVDINRVMEECVALVQPRLEPKEAVLNLNFSNELPLMLGNAARLEEAIVNILDNAIDALDRGGQIYLITTWSVDSPGEIQVIIADTGTGISLEDLPKIFDPFYTTKEVDQGTGLGLYMAHQIVEDHGGKISVQSEPGRGTIFNLTFPVTRANERALGAEARKG